MEGKVTQFTLVVSNQSKALEFYTQSVGFEKKTDVTPPGGYRWVTVGPQGQDLELALWEMGSAADPTQREWSKDWAPARSPPIVLRVADCAAAYQELNARGVQFPQPPQEYPWGIAATFRDPDGNLFSLSQPRTAWPKT
ncbi:MAG TPA: VOC family protein [Thermoplasmata archaeon]|nr:VOC family protein [Thermoplasmata archaeon]